MKVFLYLRVSSEEQAKHGYSLDAQEEALKFFCERNNHTVVGIYRDEGISGRKPYTKRPAMVQLLDDLEKVKPQMILFTKLDRWFRNIREYYKVQDILDKNKVDWKAINEEYDTSTASGRLYINIKLSIAQDEADRTSERIKDIQGQLIAQGKPLNASVPLGYKVEDKRVVFDENIHITKEAIDHYMLHQSAHATVRYINDNYDLNFSHKRLLNLLRSPLLKGEYRNNPDFCDPLLTVDEWNKLQETMPKNVKHATHRVYLFTGLVKCPCCGRNLGGDQSRERKFYRCVYRYNNTCDFGHAISEKKIEQWLLDNIEEDFRVNVTMKPKQKKTDPQKYRDQLKRLNEIYILGNIPEAEYKERSAELQKKIAEIQKTAPLKKQNFGSNWKELYQELDAEHRRSFWRNLIKEIRVGVETTDFEIVY